MSKSQDTFSEFIKIYTYKVKSDQLHKYNTLVR